MSIFANYKDVHTHRLDAGADAIINLPYDAIMGERALASSAGVSPSSVSSEHGFPFCATGGNPAGEGRSYSAGVHPWEADREVDWELLRRVAELPQVVAIGEAGLDALRGPELAVQESVFVRQARLAEEVGKPLIVHCVRAYGRLMELRRSLAPRQPWLVHGFRGKPELARQLIAAGFELSIGEKYNPGVLSAVPPRLLHRETD